MKKIKSGEKKIFITYKVWDNETQQCIARGETTNIKEVRNTFKELLRKL